MPTTAGSPALLPAETGDAFLVWRLRQAGAVIIGKANLSEWATSASQPLDQRLVHPRPGRRESVRAGPQTAPGRVRGRRPGWPPGWRRSRSAPRPTARSSAPASACGNRRHQADQRAGQPARHRTYLTGTGHTAGPMATCVADAAALLAVLAARRPRGSGLSQPRTIGRTGPGCTRPPPLTRTPSTRPRSTVPAWVSGGTDRRRPGGHRGGARRGGGPAALARRRADRPGGTARRGQDRRAGVRRAALRVQVRHQRVPGLRRGVQHGRDAARHAGRADRLQQAERRAGALPVRPGHLRAVREHERRPGRSGLPGLAAGRHPDGRTPSPRRWPTTNSRPSWR